MKKLFFAALAAILFSIPSEAQQKIYCEIVGSRVLFSKKVNITVDFGQNAGLFDNNTLVDENGKKMTFNSMVDAMNHMGSLGWEFEQAYVVTEGSGSSASNIYHWLLSKYTTAGNSTEGLKTVSQKKREDKAAKKIEDNEPNELQDTK